MIFAKNYPFLSKKAKKKVARRRLNMVSSKYKKFLSSTEFVVYKTT